MRPFPLLIVLFLVMPLVEIYVLLQVGGQIGALPTIGLCVLTAVLGAVLLRAQGISTVMRIQSLLAQGELPAVELLEGALLLVCGALLLTPGLVTDAIGFACLVPALRRSIIIGALRRGVFVQAGPGGTQGPQIIDGEFSREDDAADRRRLD